MGSQVVIHFNENTTKEQIDNALQAASSLVYTLDHDKDIPLWDVESRQVGTLFVRAD